MIEAQATAKYVRTSAQKAGLVLELIRGRAVNQALATLRFSRKRVARDIEKVLRSAIANAQQKPGFGGDVESLFVSACFAGQGPSQKRVRPAPMGRAYRVVKRTAHLTVHVAERALDIAAIVPEPASKRGEKAPAAKAKAAPKAAAKKAQAPARKKAAPAKKSGAPKKK
jgi:large subunit ribosomal protein L22